MRLDAQRFAVAAAGEEKAQKRETAKVKKKLEKTLSPNRSVHAVFAFTALAREKRFE